MKHPIVFYLTDQKISEDAGTVKLLYVEYQQYWNEHHCLSPLPVDLPLDVQLHLDIGTQLTNNVFQVNNPALTIHDFMRAGFIRDMSFEHMFEEYAENHK